MKQTWIFLCIVFLIGSYGSEDEQTNGLQLSLLQDNNDGKKENKNVAIDMQKIEDEEEKAKNKNILNEKQEELEKKDCIICTNSIEDPNEKSRIMQIVPVNNKLNRIHGELCSELMHVECLNKWYQSEYSIKGKATCPNCRQELPPLHQAPLNARARISVSLALCCYYFLAIIGPCVIVLVCMYIFGAIVLIPPFSGLETSLGFSGWILFYHLEDYFKGDEILRAVPFFKRGLTVAIFNTLTRVLQPNIIQFWEYVGVNYKDTVFSNDQYGPLLFIFVPTFMWMGKLVTDKNSYNQNIIPPVTKLMQYANMILPVFGRLDFFPQLFLSSIFQKSEIQETVWLLLIFNIITYSSYYDLESLEFKLPFIGIHIIFQFISHYY